MYEFIVAYKILPVLVCFRHSHNNIHFCFTTLVLSAFHSCWSRVFHPPVWWSRVFQSRVFSRPLFIHAWSCSFILINEYLFSHGSYQNLCQHQWSASTTL